MQRNHLPHRASPYSRFPNTRKRESGAFPSTIDAPEAVSHYDIVPLSQATERDCANVPKKAIDRVKHRDGLSAVIVQFTFPDWSGDEIGAPNSLQRHLASNMDCWSYSTTETENGAHQFTWFLINTSTSDALHFTEWAGYFFHVVASVKTSWRNFERVTPDGTVLLTDGTHTEVSMTLDNFHLFH